MRDLQPLCQGTYRKSLRAQRSPDGARETLLELREGFEPGLFVRNRNQRRGGRRGRAHVGGKIRDGDVHFVADARYGRQAARGNRPRDPFIVEAPEILE
jgi:hypothetical protein